MSILKFCGFNGFGQFTDCKTEKTVEPTDFSNSFKDKVELKNLLQCTWSFNLFASGKFLIKSGFCDDSSYQIKKVEFSDDIKQICSNEKICLVLLINYQLFKYDLSEQIVSEVHLTPILCPPTKRSIFGDKCSANNQEKVTHICSCVSSFVAITASGSVFCLPTKIFQFSRHRKVKDLASGFEHFLILDSNGDVYSWGNGSRGQLGHDSLDIVESPQIVSALAGIKITCISAGGWHSAAISAFGDLYAWGNNLNGQLGIPIYKSTVSDAGKLIQRKQPVVYHLPEIISLNCECSSETIYNTADAASECNTVRIFCGGRHSVVQMNCGRLYVSGWNKYNQLGISNETESETNTIDKFTILRIEDFSNVSDIICGHWCTVFRLKEPKSFK